MRKFTPFEDAFIRAHYLSIPTKRISTILGRAETVSRQRIKLLGLVIPPEIVEKFRKGSQIKKGSIPVNKGKRVSEYMSLEAIEKMRATQFKKGNVPLNTKGEDGIISVRSDKRTGIKYQYIRLGKGRWKELHRFNYEKHYGPIPRGMCVVFRNGNSLDAELKNLEMITRVENMKRNSIHSYPKEIVSAIKLRGKLNRKIKKLLHEK